MAIAGLNLITNVAQEAAQRLEGTARDYDRLLKLIGEARFCLLGEATHGTHEFYRERAAITKRLIKEKGFTAVAVEADWPDAFRVNRFVRGLGDDKDANEALGGFKRFPTWMWRNKIVLDFVEWLRDYNASLPPNSTRVGLRVPTSRWKLNRKITTRRCCVFARRCRPRWWMASWSIECRAEAPWAFNPPRRE